jgi:Ca2+-binding EF-hand superfamily protein
MFSVIDADGDGVITKRELSKAIRALRTLDVDSDGSITLAEASAGAPAAGPAGALGAMPGDPHVERLMANDLNGDGQLTPDEVPAALMPMLQGADSNRNRAIDRQELAAAMANARNQFGGGPFANGGGAAPVGGQDRDANDITGQFLQNDRNADGQLTEDELSPESKRQLQGADADGNGAIDAGELQAALRKMGGRARAAGAEAAGGRNGLRGRLGNRDRDNNQRND